MRQCNQTAQAAQRYPGWRDAAAMAPDTRGRWRSARVAGIRRQSGGLDAVHGAGFVLFRDVAADADGADDGAVAAANEHAARYRDHPTFGGIAQCADEGWLCRGAAGEFASAEAHAQDTPRLALGDLRPQQARIVVTLQRHQMAAGIEHRDRQRLELQRAAML